MVLNNVVLIVLNLYLVLFVFKVIFLMCNDYVIGCLLVRWGLIFLVVCWEWIMIFMIFIVIILWFVMLRVVKWLVFIVFFCWKMFGKLVIILKMNLI